MQWDNKEKIKRSYKTKEYKRPMCNYFSIGVESRIGLGFEKSRSNHYLKNKCIYGWEGIKKMCCSSRTAKIKNVIEYVSKRGEDGTDCIMFKADRVKGANDNIPIMSKSFKI